MRQRRARTATISAFGEATPRTAPVAEPVSANGSNGASDAPATEQAPIDINDPLVRARQRRQRAGYARTVS
jgi:hypothetical protein